MFSFRVEQSGLITVLKNGTPVARGFNDKESALQAIWVMEGSNTNIRYIEENKEILKCHINQ